MKEIKAYIRRERVFQAVAELQRADAPAITLIEVHAVGYGEEPNYFVPAEQLFQRYSNIVVKIEIVCADADADRLVGIIQGAVRTGFRGDGVVFVSDVSQALRIANGATGEKAL